MNRKKGFLYELNKNRTLFIMLFPALVYFFIFHYIPMGGLILAFKEYNYQKGILFSPWAGLDNFRFFFMSGKALLVTRNTVLFNLAFLVVSTFFELSVAVVLSNLKSDAFRKISHSAMFLPYFVSWVLVGAFIYNIFNYEFGTVNNILKSLNIQPFDAYGTTYIWKYVIVFVNVWKWVGYGSIIYLASITSIDPEYYDSAKMDGAGVADRIRHITIPLVTPTILTLTLLNLGQLLRGDFQMFYQIIGDTGNLFDATDIIDTLVFRLLTESHDIGLPASASFYQSVFCLITIITANYFVRKINRDNSLF